MDRPGFSFLICPDSRLLHEHLDDMLAPKRHGAFDRRVYFGDEEPPASFWQDLGSPGLLGGRKAVIMRRAEKLKAKTWQELSPVLSGVSRDIWPVFCLEGDWRGNKPSIPAHVSRQKFFQVAKKHGWIWQTPGVTARTMAEFVRAQLARRNLAAQGRTMPMLLERLPESASGIASELDKLELFLAGRQDIRPEDLDIVGGAGGLDVYPLLDALLEGRSADKVWSTVAGTDDPAALLFRLLFNLLRQTRQMLLIASGEGERAGMAPWQRDKLGRLARRVGRPRLGRVFGLALETELAVKSGELNEVQALENLVAGLIALFGTPAVAAPSGTGKRRPGISR